MDYAKNRINGDIEQAALAALGTNAYECPVCNTSVYIRGGRKNKIHFAHQNGLANNDCENYHPSSYNIDSSEALEFKTGVINESKLAFYPSLVVSISEDNYANFFLKIPYVRDLPHYDGNILFDGKFGQKIINQRTFEKDIYLPINLSNQIYKFHKEGNVANEIWKFYELGVSGLNNYSSTIFSYSFTGGRKLAENESIYRGNEYLVVFAESLSSKYQLEQLNHHITKVNSDSTSWLIYQLILPENELSQNLERILSNWIQNPIKTKPPEIQFHNTYPERIGQDGAFVFSKSTESIWFKYFNTKLSLSVINKGFSKIISRNFTEDFLFHVFFESEPEGDIYICINDDPVLFITFEESSFFNPTGIIIKYQNVVAELYSATNLLELAIQNNSSVEVILPNHKANIIKINGEKFNSEKDFITSLKSPLLIEADNFGRVVILENKALDNNLSLLPEDMNANIQRILALSTAKKGAKTTYFPCQDSSWWNRMPVQARALRARCWDVNNLPLLISLKNKLHDTYGS